MYTQSSIVAGFGGLTAKIGRNCDEGGREGYGRPASGEEVPEALCRAWPARLAASEGRRRWPRVMQLGSSRMQGGCCPKEDQRRGEAAADGCMLEGVLDPLSASLHGYSSWPALSCSGQVKACMVAVCVHLLPESLLSQQASNQAEDDNDSSIS